MTGQSNYKKKHLSIVLTNEKCCVVKMEMMSNLYFAGHVILQITIIFFAIKNNLTSFKKKRFQRIKHQYSEKYFNKTVHLQTSPF